MKNCLLITFWLITTWLSNAQDINRASLNVGDSAPLIQVEKWVKGPQVSKYEEGHVYIMEFGFISCAPCRAAIPHLTEIANHYRDKVTVISIFTAGDKVEAVENLLKKIGHKIDYSVAVDGESRTMDKTWVGASGRNGYPTIFLIDKTGKIAWIGSSPNVLDEAVQQLINEEKLNVDEQIQEFRELKRKIVKVENGDYSLALRRIDSLISLYPKDKLYVGIKIKIMLDHDLEGAYTYGWEVLENMPWDEEGDSERLHKIALKLAEGKYRKKGDKLLIAMRERIIKTTVSELLKSLSYEAIADTYYRTGDLKNGRLMMIKAAESFTETNFLYDKDRVFERMEFYSKKYVDEMRELEKAFAIVKDSRNALAEINRLIEKDASNKYYNLFKLYRLYEVDEHSAHAYGWEMLNNEQWVGNEYWLSMISTNFLRYPDGYDVAIAMNKLLLEIATDTRDIADAYSTLSWVYFLKGDIENGEEMMTKALENVPEDIHQDRREYYQSMLSNLQENYGKS